MTDLTLWFLAGYTQEEYDEAMEETIRSLVDWTPMSGLDPMRILAKRRAQEMTTDMTQAEEVTTPVAVGWDQFRPASGTTPLAEAGADILAAAARPYLLECLSQEVAMFFNILDELGYEGDEDTEYRRIRIEQLLELGA